MAATPASMVEHCNQCGATLELGQIGSCDSCRNDGQDSWTNYYLCPCGEEWEDKWDCQCNDHCPKCNKEIEPYISDDGSVPAENIDAARAKALAQQS